MSIVKSKNTWQNLVITNFILLVFLIALGAIVYYFPILENIELPLKFDWSHIFLAVILILVIEILCSTGEKVAENSQFTSVTSPYLPLIIKLSAYIISLVVAYFAFKNIVTPYLTNYQWIYPTGFGIILAYLIYTGLNHKSLLSLKPKKELLTSPSNQLTAHEQKDTHAKPLLSPVEPEESAVIRIIRHPYSENTSGRTTEENVEENQDYLPEGYLSIGYLSKEEISSIGKQMYVGNHVDSKMGKERENGGEKPPYSSISSEKTVPIDEITLINTASNYSIPPAQGHQCKYCGTPVEYFECLCNHCQEEQERTLNKNILQERIIEVEKDIATPKTKHTEDSLPVQETGVNENREYYPTIEETSSLPSGKKEEIMPPDQSKRKCESCGANLKYGALHCIDCFGK